MVALRDRVVLRVAEAVAVTTAAPLLGLRVREPVGDSVRAPLPVRVSVRVPEAERLTERVVVRVRVAVAVSVLVGEGVLVGDGLGSGGGARGPTWISSARDVVAAAAVTTVR